MRERGLHVDYTTIYHWEQHSIPELEKRCRSRLKATNNSSRVDETSINIKKEWLDLSRAVDSQGSTLEFVLSPTRDGDGAKRFFVKILTASHASEPRVSKVDTHAAYPKAFNELKAEGSISESCELRQVKYLNNVIEQDHRFIKRRVKPGLGFFSFTTAWHTLQGNETMTIIRKRQGQGVAKDDGEGQIALVAKLFGVAV